MKHLVWLFLFAGNLLSISAQQYPAPDKIYGQLFTDVQMAKIFPDGKTFVDCVPKRNPAVILADYMKLKNNPLVRYSLKLFVEANFLVPTNPAENYQSNTGIDVAAHITELWKTLKRDADKKVIGSSLLPLPYSYIVPGGRFREIYYWDSYFTMLGLQESGEYEIIEDMVKNFSYLIKTYGHIPNGNRTYYLSRSQPPFFSMMVSLLAEIRGENVFKIFLPAMEKEYNYWMEGSASTRAGEVYKRIVKLKDGTIMNRYWDDNSVPRQESYAQDVETAEKSLRKKTEMYSHLRAGAASGWDFSSRWFSDAKNLTTIQTTDIIPVDLNCLLYALEMNIAKGKVLTNEKISSHNFINKAARRKAAILKYCWNAKVDFFTDYNFRKSIADTVITPAGVFPMFVNVATQLQAGKITTVIQHKLLKEGGIITSNNQTGEQWDAPNGWAPLQWVTIKGLENYDRKELASDIAKRWIALNEKVFKATGKMMEKYNVQDTQLQAGGGEYPGQDGFGWTNGVYLKLVHIYKNKVQLHLQN
ncbi:MAG: alpha,alpha-trehalase TreA [Chitinophagaceae bacterium]